MKNINRYADFTVRNWITPDSKKVNASLAIMALGLCGEAGEVAEHIKKLFRDGKLDRALLEKELGDVIYYWARLCRKLGFVPSRVIAKNEIKLKSRRKRGTTRGWGDNR